MQDDKPVIAVFVPVKQNLHPALKARCQKLCQRMVAANPDYIFEFVVDEVGVGNDAAAMLGRSGHIALVRNRMIDHGLKAHHDWVLWVDSDLVEFPADLPTQLIGRIGMGVAAPVVLYETDYPRRFYDLNGFVDLDGSLARLWYPWFSQKGPVYDLLGVGCIYILPRAVYDSGARYVGSSQYTDHFSVCEAARKMGLPVRAYGDLHAVHAALPKYGEAEHL